MSTVTSREPSASLGTRLFRLVRLGKRSALLQSGCLGRLVAELVALRLNVSGAMPAAAIAARLGL